MGPQAVDRYDAGMLEAAGDFGLEQEAMATDGVVGVLVEDLLQGHFPVQLDVLSDENGPQGPAHRGGGPGTAARPMPRPSRHEAACHPGNRPGR